MKNLFFAILSILIFTSCSLKNQNINSFETKTKKLAFEVQVLSNTIDKNEAKDLAYEAITYSKYLAKTYDVKTPALIHNTLINMNIKKRGLCYHYANDLLKYLKKKNYKSFKLIKTIANKNEYFEHSAIAITAKNVDFENSIILDAWRHEGELYFSKIKNDKKYNWEKE